MIQSSNANPSTRSNSRMLSGDQGQGTKPRPVPRSIRRRDRWAFPRPARRRGLAPERSASVLENGNTSNCKARTLCRLASTRLLLYAGEAQTRDARSRNAESRKGRWTRSRSTKDRLPAPQRQCTAFVSSRNFTRRLPAPAGLALRASPPLLPGSPRSIGREMVSSHDQSSGRGSRMTVLPSFRIRTSLDANRNSFGRRTACERPVMNTLASPFHDVTPRGYVAKDTYHPDAPMGQSPERGAGFTPVTAGYTARA